MKRICIGLVVTILVFTLAFQVFAGGQKEEEKELKFGYLCKLLSHPWFINEAKGVESKCNQLGVDYIEADANLNNESYMAALDSMIAQGVDGIIHVVPLIDLGPAVVARCKEANIPYIAIDDALLDSEGNPAPFVGMPSIGTGELGGHALAKEAKKRGFFKEGNIVKILALNLSIQQVVNERVIGYKNALMEDIPELTEDNFIIKDAPDMTLEVMLPVASALINAHPEVTHWIFPGINEDAAIAPIRVCEEIGIPLENVLGCGLCATTMSVDEFKKPHNSYITIGLWSFKHGEVATQILYDYITKGTPMPQLTEVSGEMIFKETYKNYSY